MKKITSTILALFLVFSLSACGSTNDSLSQAPASSAPSTPGSSSSQESSAPVPDAASSQPSDKADTARELPESSAAETSAETTEKILIAYFSRMGNMNFDPSIDAVTSATVQATGSEYVGNNKIMADMLAEKTGGDLYFIEQVGKYPAAYRATTDQVKEEQTSGARPALVASVENMEQYSTVVLVYPIWWGTLPPGVCTFLETYDFGGKTILPVATHEGSGLGSSAEDIAARCPGATLLEGLAVRGSAVKDADPDVEAWLNASGIL